MKILNYLFLIFYLFPTISVGESMVEIKVPKIEEQYLNGESLFNKK